MKILLPSSRIGRFCGSVSGETSIQLATFFGALAILIALVATPFLDETSRTYAENQQFGIDYTVTGSIEKKKRYTIRKSVLDKADTNQ